MFATWLLGVLLAVTASVVSNLGLNLQKRAHMNMEKAHHAHHHHHPPGGAPGTRRQRSGSTAGTGTPNDASGKVTFAPASLDLEKDSRNSDKPVNPLSPSGILKKGGGKTTPGGYHLMDGADADEDAMVRRDEARKAEQQAARGERSVALPVSPDAQRQNSAASAGDSSVSNSYTPANEIAAGAIGMHSLSDKHHAGSNGTAASSNTPSGRTRSMSAAGTGSQRVVRTAGAHGPGSRHSTRRRSSLGMDAMAVAAAGGQKPAKSGGHYTRQPLWVVGIICVILGSLFDFAALAFVDQAVVAPLGSLTLVSNVFFSPLLLKEKVTRKQLYCTALIIAGSILAVAFAPHESASPNIQEMFDNFLRARFIVYGVLSILFLIGLRYASAKFKRIRRQDPPRYARVARYHTFCYAACAGIMGAQSVLFAKCTAMLLAASFSGDGLMFVYWGTYFVLLGLGVTIFLQIRWLNSGLRSFSALLIVPIFQSFWILVSVIAGMIFFGEYAGVFGHPANAVMFPLGLLLTVTGVYFLTRIAAPGAGAVDDSSKVAAGQAAASGTPSGAAGTQHRRRSRSTAHRNSLSGISSGSGLNESLISAETKDAGGLSDSAVPGTSSSPLLSSAGSANVQDHYGVPQSPRDPSPLQVHRGPGGRLVRPTPVSTSGAGATQQGMAKANLDRSVEAGSYSDSTGADLLRASPVPGDDEQDGEGDEDVSGSESGSGSDGSGSGDDEESPDPAMAESYATVMMHSHAPLAAMFLPTSLMGEALSPRAPYFEENASGFDGGSGVGEGGNSISMGGLPYANIFRVREGMEEEHDEENPQGSPHPLGGYGHAPGGNLFAASPRGPPSARGGFRGAGLNGLATPVSPGGPSHMEWHAHAAVSASASAADGGAPASPSMTSSSRTRDAPDSPSRTGNGNATRRSPDDADPSPHLGATPASVGGMFSPSPAASSASSVGALGSLGPSASFSLSGGEPASASEDAKAKKGKKKGNKKKSSASSSAASSVAAGSNDLTDSLL